MKCTPGKFGNATFNIFEEHEITTSLIPGFQRGFEKIKFVQGTPFIRQVYDAIYLPAGTSPSSGKHFGSITERNGNPIESTYLNRGVGELLHENRSEDLNNIDIIEEPAIYLGWWFDHYGHFMTETLSRHFALAKASGRLALFHAPYGKKNSHFDYIFENACGSKPIFFTKPTLLKNTIVPEPAFIPRREVYSAFNSFALNCDVRENNKIHAPVYFSRRYLPSNKIDDDEHAKAEKLLSESGFLIVYPEFLSVSDQQIIFNSHDYFCGYIGSALHTVISSSHPKNIIALCDRPINQNFTLVQGAMGGNITFINCIGNEKLPSIIERMIHIYKQLRIGNSEL